MKESNKAFFVVLRANGAPGAAQLFEGEELATEGPPDKVSVLSKDGNVVNSYDGILCGRDMTVQEARLMVSRLRDVGEVLES